MYYVMCTDIQNAEEEAASCHNLVSDMMMLYLIYCILAEY